MRNMIQKVSQYMNKLLNLTINNQKGVVLPIILMAIGGLSLIGAAAVSVSSGEMSIAHNDRNYKIAFNLAEAGINDAADGIAGNRDLLPVPLGVITNASYSFNVGGAAFNDTGRYSVNVSLPVVTTVKTSVPIGASNVEVYNITGLSQGNSIIIGDSTTHIMATISSITPTGGNAGILNLVDGRNQPYIFAQVINADTMYVARNWIRVTSTGDAGTGLGSTYTAVALWRASSAINANPTMTAPAAGPGMIRSKVTLQAEYSIQEINIMDTLNGNANPVPAAPQKFSGPILVTTSLTGPQPYTQGDYTGPIFAPTNKITGGQISFDGQPYDPITNGVNPKYPKVIPISTTAANKANVANILAQSDANAQCYQQACNVATATQQIYNINGYQMDIKVFKQPASGSMNLLIDDESTDLNTNGDIVFNFVLTQNFTLTSNDNTTLMYTPATSPVTLPTVNTTTTLKPSNATIIYQGNPADTGSVQVAGGNSGNIVFSGKGPGGLTYSAGTIVSVTIPKTEAAKLGAGYYVWLYDNSNNIPGLGTGKNYSNGVFMTALGNIQSQQWQGDLSYQTDAGQGSHTHFNPVIQTTAPATYVRGLYAVSDSTLGTFTTTPVVATNDMGAVLFGGRKSNDNTWVVGDRTEFWLTYLIHTNGPNCVDHDIQIVSRTKVTYLGTSTKCSDTDVQRVFVYETVWNHLPTNGLNIGVQSDDNDPKLTKPVAHKGYFKWSGGKDVADNELIIVGKSRSILMGDKEFNSVFNHSADSRFHSAIVNLNISQMNMIGSANPPTIYNAGRMYISPVAFPTVTAWLPANSKNWDWTEIIGNRSAFLSIPVANGFDLTDFSIASGSVLPYMQNGNSVLPDVSNTPGAGGTTGYALYKATTSPGEVTAVQNGSTVLGTTWANNGTASFPNDGTPIMNANQMGTTTITATISGPWFSTFNVRRGSVNLFFDAANGIPFNVQTLSVTTKGSGSSITMGSAANPVAVYANSFKLTSEDCGGQTNFNFTGKMIASSVTFSGNVKYVVDTTITNAPGCLAPNINNLIYLKKTGWQEIRN